MPLFTFVLDYKGGTYVDQITAPSIKSAPGRWASKLNEKAIVGLGKRGKEKLIHEMTADRPVPLRELRGTWCLATIINGNLAFITVIATLDSR